jgi:hypothetical protein
MAIKHVFCSRLSSCNYVLKDGKVVHFVAGRYYTDVKKEIDELTELCEGNHETFYVDPGQKEVDTETLDPLSYIKKKAVEEYIAAQAAAMKPTNDRGNTTQGAKVNMQTTDKLVVAAESNK